VANDPAHIRGTTTRVARTARLRPPSAFDAPAPVTLPPFDGRCFKRSAMPARGTLENGGGPRVRRVSTVCLSGML
jgi:hypothetical protein